MQSRPVWLSAVVAVILAVGLGAEAAAAQAYPAADVQAPAQPSTPTATTDPPGRVARIAIVQGNVSVEPAGVDSFSQAELNYPLTVGDRMYVDLQGLAELQTAGLAVRMANGADVTLASLSDAVAQFGLAQGSIRVAARDLLAPDNTAAVVEVDTPNGSVLVQQPGDFRVDSYPQDDSTVVTVTSGQVEVTGPSLNQVLTAGQSLRLAGNNPVQAQMVGELEPDALDRFDSDRESLYAGAANAEAQYVEPDMIGAADLDQYGDWAPSADYGEVWCPRGVAVGWVPYQNGHWAWIAPWGWTWVEAEPWGFAPFHYGRWAFEGSRWVWVPGPPPRVIGRPVRPIYSPALVAFVGGAGFSLAIGFGGSPGAGVTAWFPLGPREPYVPWYHASVVYTNRVNATNLYVRNQAEFRGAYANRTTDVYTANLEGIVYANRPVATTVVTQKDFAAGRPVAKAQPVRLDATTRAQLNVTPVLPHPMVTPARTSAAPQAPARVVPPVLARPVLATRTAVARPAAVPEPVASHAAPIERAAPASVNAEKPAAAAPTVGGYPQPRGGQPAAVATRPPGPLPGRAPDQPRTLINRTEPQPAQPSFQRQQEAIDLHEPGRPLGPQQLQNLREGRPAGPPAPQPRPAPPPAARPAPAPQPAPAKKP
jgi:hypothetical protein